MILPQKKELTKFSMLMLTLCSIGSVIMLFAFSSEELILTKIMDKETIKHHRTSTTSFDSTKALLIPITADYNNQTFHFNASCSDIPSSGVDSWFYVGIEVLNEKQEYEYATELSFWDARGYDSEGAWHQSHLEEDFKFVRLKKGKFYIKITSIDYDVTPYRLFLNVNSRNGSTIAFWLILLLSISSIIFLANYLENLGKRKRSLHYD